MVVVELTKKGGPECRSGLSSAQRLNANSMDCGMGTGRGSYDVEAGDCKRLSGREGGNCIWESRKDDELL